jgi:hypothetical protein
LRRPRTSTKRSANERTLRREQRYAAAKLVANGRPDEAAPLLEEAARFFRSVRASRYLGEIDALFLTRASAS